jgi:hypothetical protein
MTHISREAKELAREIAAHTSASFRAAQWIDEKGIARSIQHLMTAERNRALKDAAKVCLGMVRKAPKRKPLKPLPPKYRVML